MKQMLVIGPDNKKVKVVDKNGCSTNVGYDRLGIATGAVSVEPDIEGLQLPGVFTLRGMDDGSAMQNYITKCNPKSAIVIGAGCIGMEMSDALTYRVSKSRWLSISIPF
ncbi:MAG: FAD-dependent oxidoreductase [Desulfobacterales bacterium]|nr:MAG: FAD-dependent oxidoreductase [Desulfobacterales bacterium]